jgi:hypothetical protein
MSNNMGSFLGCLNVQPRYTQINDNYLQLGFDIDEGLDADVVINKINNDFDENENAQSSLSSRQLLLSKDRSNAGDTKESINSYFGGSGLVFGTIAGTQRSKYRESRINQSNENPTTQSV